MAFKDLTGMHFGRLTVLSRAEDSVRADGKRDIRWFCECSCEKHTQVIIFGHNLTKKRNPTMSCGCIAREYAREHMKIMGKQYGILNKKHNNYVIDGDTVHIYLTNCDDYTDVSLDKWNQISFIGEFCWSKNGAGYAVAAIPTKYREQFDNKSTIGLHQLICPCDEGLEPDHKDRNRLNNITDNLVPKTHLNNNLNKGLINTNTSGITGVCWAKREQKWRARIVLHDKEYGLGYYTNFDDAVRARLNAEVKYYGEFAPQKHLYAQYGIIDDIQHNDNVREP